MKYSHIPFLLLLLFSIKGFAQDMEKSGEVNQKWKTYQSDLFTIQYPESWTPDDSGTMGAQLFLFAPLESEQDRFRENINVLIQDIATFNLDLSSYADLSKRQIETMATNGEILESRRINLEDKEYHKMVYQADQGTLRLQFEQYYFIRNDKAFVVTLTCEADKFSTYQAVGEVILNSFDCGKSVVKEEPTKTVLPFELELGGVLRTIENTQNSTPPITLLVKRDSIEITVGQTEQYHVLFDTSEFTALLPLLNLADFQSDAYYFNAHMPYGGTIKTRKNIDGLDYERTITNFKRSDIEVEYLNMDSVAIFKSYHLSRIANEIVLPFLKDTMSKANMIIARSMKEALQHPEKVYKLGLRNTRTSRISSDIGQLINLRVLDISGSLITELPPAIEACKELRMILANASQLTKISPTIGKLEKLRVLNLGFCKLKSVPAEIGDLTSLWSLNLSDNQLNTIPSSFSNLKNVTFFSIANNRLKTFPPAILGMKSVGNLWIHKNEISVIPLDIKQMPRLHHLLLTKSHVTNLEDLVRTIPHVRIIDEK
ncbi:MAG: leucine-rich repeat domain-containing protein [Bacteroidota bacterium]